MAIKTKTTLCQPIKAAPMPAYVAPAVSPYAKGPRIRNMLEPIGQPAKRRGRPPSGKVRVHIMLNPATVEAIKAGGPGWQQRISDILDRETTK